MGHGGYTEIVEEEFLPAVCAIWLNSHAALGHQEQVRRLSLLPPGL